ncbi:MAG: hypothetical protein K0S28_1160 [Paucimonas sp.]|jgi:diguanylate cyclase (GGDEF)-like protein/PAS domain S-box-containing protein|nr:hypothetical protein [Paucimonas sp.]
MAKWDIESHRRWQVETTRKILVVVDGDDEQRALRHVLASAEFGWEVECCDSGSSALPKVAELKPDCIVLDYRLPDMSGPDFFQALKAAPAFRERDTIPVMMLISPHDETAVADAVQSGVEDYLFKDARGNFLALLPPVLRRALREREIIEERESTKAALSKLESRYEYLFLGVADGIIIADQHRIIESTNPSACRMFGYQAGELQGQPLTLLMQPGDHVLVGHEFDTYLKTGTGRFIGQGALEVQGVRKGGEVFTLEVAIDEIEFDGARMFAAVMRDTTERHRVRQLVQESEARFRTAFDNAPVGMALISLDGQWLRVNRALCDMLGYDEQELLHMSFQDVTHPDDLGIDQTFVQLVLADQLKSYQMETRYFHKDGRAMPISLNSSLVRDEEGKPLYFMAKIEDITQRKKMEDALYAEKDLAQTTLQSIGDAVITADAAGSVTYLNPMAERLTGWSNREAIGQPLDHVFVVVDEGTRAVVESPGTRALKDGKICGGSGNLLLVARNGLEANVEPSASPIRVRDGSLTGVVMVFHDVSEARALNRKISYQASHDALTGLLNRVEFELMATQLLQSARSAHRQHALMYLDLDQFKLVNDTCGHLAGDELLRQLATLLSSNMRKSDTLARLGGDEFGLLLEACPQDRAIEIAQHLIDTVRAFRFEWEGKLFGVGLSIGMVMVNDHSRDLQTLLKAADAACYAAKEKGRNRVELFRQGDASAPEQPARIDWISRLQSAAAEHRFALHYQKIVPVVDQRASCHVEILLRYRDEQGRLLLPMAFLPAAERYGLLASIDRWVVRQTLGMDPSLLPDDAALIAVNISGTSLADGDFQDFLKEELRASRIPVNRLCIEISEAAAISNLHRSIALMQMLRSLGCSCALDEFGSSLSSLAHLKSLPVDYLKINGSLTKNLTNDPVDYATLESIHRIAKVMKIRTIAKFVENYEALPHLRRIGIDFAQGFALHEPEQLLTKVVV